MGSWGSTRTWTTMGPGLRRDDGYFFEIHSSLPAAWVYQSFCDSGPLQRPRDQHFHDLVGAAIDPLDPRIAKHPRDRERVHIAVAAVELQTAVDDLALEIGDPVFGHGRCGGIKAALEVARDAMVDEHLGDRRLGLAFG